MCCASSGAGVRRGRKSPIPGDDLPRVDQPPQRSTQGRRAVAFEPASVCEQHALRLRRQQPFGCVRRLPSTLLDDGAYIGRRHAGWGSSTPRYRASGRIGRGSRGASRLSTRSVSTRVRVGRWNSATSVKPRPAAHEDEVDRLRPLRRRGVAEVGIEPNPAPAPPARGRAGRVRPRCGPRGRAPASRQGTPSARRSVRPGGGCGRAAPARPGAPRRSGSASAAAGRRSAGGSPSCVPPGMVPMMPGSVPSTMNTSGATGLIVSSGSYPTGSSARAWPAERHRIAQQRHAELREADAEQQQPSPGPACGASADRRRRRRHRRTHPTPGAGACPASATCRPRSRSASQHPPAPPTMLRGCGAPASEAIGMWTARRTARLRHSRWRHAERLEIMAMRLRIRPAPPNERRRPEMRQHPCPRNFPAPPTFSGLAIPEPLR